MSCYKLERSQDQRELLIDELTKGHKLACQLVALLSEQKTSSSNERIPIVQEIMGSFHGALKALDSGVRSQKHKRNENPLQIGRIQSAHATGGRKTRSLPYSYTLTKSKSLNDGHSWRKYGQKKIFNAKFPRSYFRCPHKYDQGCKATRQVQQSEQDPSRFTVTYFGQHTCRDPFEVASSCIEEDPCTINFASPSEFDANFKQPQLSTLKQEDSCEDVVSNIATPGSSLSNCFMLPEFGLSEMLSLLA